MNRIMRLGRTALLATALAFAFIPTAEATVARYLDLEEHLSLTQLVVRGKVRGATTFIGERGLPFTDTEVEILEVFHGEYDGETIRVRQMKGEADGTYTEVPGDAQLLPGEDVILFLRAQDGPVAYLTALGQSKYGIEELRVGGGGGIGGGIGGDDGGGLVVRDLSDLSFYLQGATPPMAAGIEEAPVDLKLFRQTIRDLAKGLK